MRYITITMINFIYLILKHTFFRDWYGAGNTFENIIQCLDADHYQQHALMAVLTYGRRFSTKIEKSIKNNKNLLSQIFFVGNKVNDPLNLWSIY